MEGLDTVNSAADLSASFTPEATATETDATMQAEPELSEPVSLDAEGPETLLEDLNSGAETAEAEQTADAEAEPVEETPTEEAPAEELPDGVHAVDRNGRKEYRLNEPRYQAFHGAYKTLRELSEIAGEPITKEAFELRNNALIAENRLYSDMLSGEPDAQGKVIDFFFDQAKQAIEGGDVAGNPMIPFTQTFYTRLQQHDPEAYAALRQSAAKDLIEEMYGEAAAKQSKSLFLSAGHIAKTLGLPFKAEAEMPDFFAKQGQVDPLSAKDKRIQELEAQLNGRQKQNAEQQFAAWRSQTGQAVRTAIMDKAIMPSLASLAEQGYWKTHPEAFKDLVVDRLNSAVAKTINGDGPFNVRVADLNKSAQRAVSEQRRDAIRQQIEQLFVNKAGLVIETLKPQIIKDANDRVQGQSAATHQRRQGAQNHRAPAGGGTPVKRSLVPADLGDFEVGDPASLRASLNKLLQ